MGKLVATPRQASRQGRQGRLAFGCWRGPVLSAVYDVSLLRLDAVQITALT